MDCIEVKRLLDHYLAGRLNKRQDRLIEEHLAACSSCQSLFLVEDEQLDQLLADNWYEEQPGDQLVRLVMAELPPQKRPFIPRLAAVLVGWFAYWSFWLLAGAVFFLKKTIGWGTIIAVGRVCCKALAQLNMAPLGFAALLLTLTGISFAFYCLEREEKII